MRPTRLEITAFGPFGDTAVVDFDRLPTDRPFVISGPTGSGKTTLFDAMCFALYGGLPGQRARHTEVRSGFADINAVAQVALEFEIDGVIHRIERIPKQRRAKKRQKGFTDDPGSARLRRLDRTGWTTLCSKKGELEDRVHELLGIDADLFQRSVLLPQGEFQRVLNAGTDERSALLRALFGTDIYPRALARLGDERSSLGRRIAEADAASRDRRGQVTRQVAAARRHLGEVGPEHDHTSAAPSPADGPSEDVTAADGHHDGGRDNVIDLRTPEAGSPPEAGLDDKGVRTVESLRDELEEVIEGPFAGLRSAAESAGEDARTAQGRAEVARSQAADIGERARLVGIVAADRAGAAARSDEADILDRADAAAPVAAALDVVDAASADVAEAARRRAAAWRDACAAVSVNAPVGQAGAPWTSLATELDDAASVPESAHVDQASALASELKSQVREVDRLVAQAIHEAELREVGGIAERTFAGLSAESEALDEKRRELDRRIDAVDAELATARAEAAREEMAGGTAEAARRTFELATTSMEKHSEAERLERRAADLELRRVDAERTAVETSERLAEMKESAGDLESRSATLLEAERRRDALEDYLRLAASIPDLEAEDRVASDTASATFTAYVAGTAPRLASSLVDGEPCPVCGSAEHPNPAEADVSSAPTDVESVTAANTASNSARSALMDARHSLAAVVERDPDLPSLDPVAAAARVEAAREHRGEAVAAKATLGAAQRDVREAAHERGSVDAAIGDLESRRSELAAELHRIRGALGDSADCELDELEQRWRAAASEQAAARAARSRAVGLEATRDELAGQVLQAGERASAIAQDLAGLRSRLELALEEADSIAQEIAASLGQRAPAVVTEELRRAADSVDGLLIAARSEMSARDRLAVAESRAADAMAEAGLATAESARAAALPLVDRQARRSALTAQLARVEAAESRLQELMAKDLPEVAPDRDVLEAAAECASARFDDLRRRAAAAETLLDDARHGLDGLDDSEQGLASLRQRHALLDRIIRVLGGSGTRLRVPLEAWVLAAYLRDVVGAANVHLREMSHDRYELEVADPTGRGSAHSGLDLAVLDSRTGATRPTKSLSGGETFLASLALALGLADVATAGSAGVHLDALFVDEGFGSLDADAVDLAITVLDGLRSRGAMVGVITHVDAVKEALPVAIEVTSRSDGRGSQVEQVA